MPIHVHSLCLCPRLSAIRGTAFHCWPSLKYCSSGRKSSSRRSIDKAPTIRPAQIAPIAQQHNDAWPSDRRTASGDDAGSHGAMDLTEHLARCRASSRAMGA